MAVRRLPPLHAIRAFEAAARHLSMTRAAAELALTPGAVSRHVRALEIEMKTPLFLRRSTGLVLTSAGETLAETTRDALDGIANAVGGLRLKRLRRLTIGAYGLFISRVLLPAWPRLIAAHPDLEIDIHTSSSALDLVPGRYDAVIAVSDGAPRAGTTTHRLLPIATLPVCAPSWLENGDIDFATIPLLHARPRPDDWRRWLDHAGFSSVGAQSGSSFESLGLALEAAAAGMGCTIAIERLLPENLAPIGLARAHACVRPTRRHFILQYETRLAGDPAMVAFANWLLDELATADQRTIAARR